MIESSTQPVYAILGATGGIGAALCRRLATSGARLVIGARDEVKLAALATEFNATYLDAQHPDDHPNGRIVAGDSVCVEAELLTTAWQRRLCAGENRLKWWRSPALCFSPLSKRYGCTCQADHARTTIKPARPVLASLGHAGDE